MKQRILVSALVFLLAACSEPQQSPEVPVADSGLINDAVVENVASEPPLVGNAAGSAPTAFNTSITVQELMQSMIDPNADRLWKAVSYVATETGVQETMPVTDADWQQLLDSAITLVEAGNALQVPGRPVAGADYDAQRPAFQFSAAEIQARRAAREENWAVISRGMQDLVLETLDAVRRRDIFALTDKGAAINEACEACHASFWYRPQ